MDEQTAPCTEKRSSPAAPGRVVYLADPANHRVEKTHRRRAPARKLLLVSSAATRSYVVAAIAGSTSLLLAASAIAAWSADPYPRACPAAFGFSAAGRGVALVSSDTGGEPSAAQGSWSSLAANGTYGRFRRLDFAPAALALYGRDGFGAIGYSGRSGKLRPPFRVYASVGTIGKGRGKRHALPGGYYRQIASLGLTVSAGGHPIALQSGAASNSAPAVSQIVLTTDELRKSTLLARGRNVGPARLAGNAHGQALVAWRSGGSIYARIRTARGRLLPRQRLGKSANDVTIVPGINAGGDAFVAWSSAPVSAGLITGNRTIAVAFRVRGKRFSRARRLDAVAAPAVYSDNNYLQASFAGTRIVFAWTTTTVGPPASGGVRVELAAANGRTLTRFMATQDPRAYLTSLAAATSGTAALGWAAGPDLTPYLGLLAPRSDVLSEPERIGDQQFHDGPTLGIDPRSQSILAFGPQSPGCWFAARAP